jgi:D-glycero-D-manno-heptose 1,7-bisphosphate phosphatase
MAQYRAVEAKLRQLLGGDAVDAVFACPFLPGVQGIYGQEHSWRKPGDGMLLAAALMLHLDLSESVIVGDSLSDLLAGARAGNRWLVHVLTGHGAQEREAVVEHFEQASSPESMGHKLLLLDNISQLNPTLLKIP